MICNPDDYQKFVRGIDSGDVRDFRDTPLGPKGSQQNSPSEWKSQFTQQGNTDVRAWESAGAGPTFDLESSDAPLITMPLASKLDRAASVV